MPYSLYGVSIFPMRIVPSPHREANKTSSITEGGKNRAVRLHNTLVEGNALLQLPNPFHPATDILAAAEANIAIAGLASPIWR